MTRERVTRVVKVGYVAAVILALAWYISRLDMAAYSWAAWFGSSGPYAFVTGWALMAAVLGFAWSRVVRSQLGLTLRAPEWLRLQAAAWLGRYLPGKIGLFAGKLGLVERHRVPLSSLGFTVVYEQVAFVAAGVALALCTPGVLFGSDVWNEAWDAMSFVRFAAAICACVAVLPVMRLVGRLLRVPRLAGPQHAWRLPFWYVAAHAVAGTGLYLCLAGRPDISGSPSLLYAVGLLAAANVAGIVAVFAPAGLGVREAVLVAGLTPWLTLDAAVVTATMLRVLSVLADLLFCAIALAMAQLLARRNSRQRQADGR